MGYTGHMDARNDKTLKVRVTGLWLDMLDRWRAANATQRSGWPSESDAVRTLVTEAIAAHELAIERSEGR